MIKIKSVKISNINCNLLGKVKIVHIGIQLEEKLIQDKFLKIF
jgi:hypothetical protein